MAINSDAFNAHIDVCDQCEQSPFDLCEEGYRLLLDVGPGAAPASPLPRLLPLLRTCPEPWAAVADDGEWFLMDAHGVVLAKSKARGIIEALVAFPDLFLAGVDGLAILSSEFKHHHVAEPERRGLRDALRKAGGKL